MWSIFKDIDLPHSRSSASTYVDRTCPTMANKMPMVAPIYLPGKEPLPPGLTEEHREQLNLIAEKLLEVETLDARQIKSLFETGKMPEPGDDDESDSHSEEPAVAETYEEAKEKAENEEEQKQHDNVDKSVIDDQQNNSIQSNGSADQDHDEL